jgi:hypothetical protein
MAFSFSFMFFYWTLNRFVALDVSPATASLVSQQSSEDRHVSLLNKLYPRTSPHYCVYCRKHKIEFKLVYRLKFQFQTYFLNLF